MCLCSRGWKITEVMGIFFPLGLISVLETWCLCSPIEVEKSLWPLIWSYQMTCWKLRASIVHRGWIRKESITKVLLQWGAPSYNTLWDLGSILSCPSWHWDLRQVTVCSWVSVLSSVSWGQWLPFWIVVITKWERENALTQCLGYSRCSICLCEILNLILFGSA